MAQKRKTPTKRTTSKKRTASSKKKGGFSLGKFTLGLLILVGLAYTGLALKEGQLVPDSLKEFKLNMPELNTSDEPKQTPEQEEKPPANKISSLTNDSIESPITESFKYDSFDLYFTSAFDFMWPAYSASEAIIERPYYTIRYSEEHEQAMWVAYKLVADSLMQGSYQRKDNFREDPRVRTGSADLTDYRNSGFDRGHLAPAADFSYDEFALSQSFYMSNMSPQNPGFNRGIWKKLEEQVRDWAKENNSIYVVTGPVLNKELKTIGKNKVSVPEYYYKIVLDIEKPEIKAIAFLMKNEKSSDDLSTFVVSIDELERLTKLDFFPSMPDELEDTLETLKAPELWFKQ